MNKYNIAVIIAGIDEAYQNTILNGIEAYAESHDLNITIFVSFSGTMSNQRHDTGEFNIFNLPNFNMFDGAILLTNTIAYQPVVGDILSRIKQAGIPAVSIDNDIADFYHIGINNGIAMRRITEHFIKYHKFNKLNYISGPQDNPESIARLDAFLEVLKENNIEIENERIYYGDFRAPSGKAAVSQFMNSALEKPQAIICANDVMAISAMTELADSGMSIPADIAVSGFDNTYSGKNYFSELTSVERPLALSGELACQKLLNHFNDTPQERSVILDMCPKFTESCGCTHNSVSDIHTFKQTNYDNFIKFGKTSDYLIMVNRMSCELVECDSFSEYIEVLKPFVREINAEEFYLCICDDWTIDSKVSDNLTKNEFNQFTVHGYTENLLVPLAYKNGKFCEHEQFKSEKLIPGMFDSDESRKSRYFIPLHFREKCLGYMVIVNSRFPLDSSMFQTWCITISNALENIRKIIFLDYAVKKLDRLYTVDTLSEIYNRNGFVKNTSSLYSYCIKRKRPVMLMFIDMDELKTINDTYGHNVGDRAIHDIASAIRKSCTKGEVYCRFGGDEFIIFGADYSEKNAERLIEKIEFNIQEINETKNNPYKLSASSGYHITCPNTETDIFSLVTLADNIMYVQKKKKKTSKYLKNNTYID